MFGITRLREYSLESTQRARVGYTLVNCIFRRLPNHIGVIKRFFFFFTRLRKGKTEVFRYLLNYIRNLYAYERADNGGFRVFWPGFLCE